MGITMLLVDKQHLRQQNCSESDSKLLVDCVNDINFTPWRIYDEVKELKAHMETTDFILSHFYKEANKVADLLTSLSYDILTTWSMMLLQSYQLV
ncbi:hypothetical protein KY290_036226 [Solanum tuberosum]|uniref:RNase H type-1 domain-containing protein n=1 Tax=Solanum tuberosum TaxID=4113 RepID=A0ABQ7TTN3_SOLTU|nr:hypothetical protein KY290_036226 [Solanum tuberosum]